MKSAEDISDFEFGALQERARIMDFMSLPEAEGREGAALAIALRGDVSLSLARELLAAVHAGPKHTFKTRLLVPRHLRLAAAR